MINFTKIRWKNFLSTGNSWIEIELNKSQNCLIVGDNGSGKSTFLDALTFVLFGKPYRKIGKIDVVNSINEKECSVEIEFTTSSGNYKVIRGLKPTVFEIYHNSKMINQDSVQRSQQEILEKLILGMDYKTFTQVVILGSSSFVPFMQLSLSDRRSVIENLLGIEVFSAMSQVVKYKSQMNREKLELVRLDLQAATSKKLLLERTKEELSKSSEAKLDVLVQRLKTYKETIKNKKATIEELVGSMSDMTALDSSRQKLESKAKKAEVLLASAQNSIARLQSDIAYLNEHDECSTCHQSISEEFKHLCSEKYQKKIDELRQESVKVEELKRSYLTKIDSVLVELKKVAGVGNQIASLRFEIETTKGLIESVNREIKEAKIPTGLDESLLSDIKEVYNNIASLEKLRVELLDERSYISVASSILKESGIKTQIVRQYLPVINKTINQYLTIMGFFASFSLNEEFSETIKSRYIDAMSYHNLSEGEKFRVDLSILLSWRKVAKMKNSVHTNLLVFDEVFDGSLDASGVEEFVKIIWSMESGINTFLISHKQDQLMDKFEKVYRFEKSKGGWSKLVEA